MKVYIRHIIPLQPNEDGYDPEFKEWESYLGWHFLYEYKNKGELLIQTWFSLCRVYEIDLWENWKNQSNSHLFKKDKDLTVEDLRKYFTDRNIDIEFIEEEID